MTRLDRARRPSLSQKTRRALLVAAAPKWSALPEQRRRAVLDALRGEGFTPQVRICNSPAHVSPTIRRHAHSAALVAVAGGDGTLNAALHGLVETGLPLLALPLGTANDLARSLALSSTPEECCGLVSQGRLRAIDVARVNDAYYVNAASIGLSAEVARRLSGDRKRRWGLLAYGAALADAWHASRVFSASVQCDDETHRLRAIQVCVGNGRYHGGGLAVAADASIDDGLLDVYVLQPQSRWRLLAMYPALRRGSHASWSTVTSLRARRVVVHTKRPKPVNVDGELAGSTPVHFEVIPRAVEVFVPDEAG